MIDWLIDCRELVKKLQERGTPVYLVSGGFKRIIQRAAEQLNIPNENIFANRLLFDDEGINSSLLTMHILKLIFY